MENLLKKLLESTKTDRKGLVLLKHTAVRCQNFELAARLRELENKLFPETKEEKDTKEQMKQFDMALRMVGLNIDNEIKFTIFQTVEAHKKMKGKFDLKTASKIIAKSKEIFNND